MTKTPFDPARPPSGRPSPRAVLALLAGNGLELYDFTLFSFFSLTLARVFFPASGDWTGLVLVLSTFASGFVTRPLGGLVFGAYADRHGRRRAITLTIGLMTLGTAMVALCPGYRQVGVAAPALLVAARLLQGFAIGGEIGPATTLLLETSPPGRRGLMVSLQMTSQGISALLGAATGVLLSAWASPEAILAGAWRIPFLLGLVLGPVGLYLRASLRSPTPSDASPRQREPIGALLRQRRGQAAAGVATLLYGTAAMYVVVFYAPTYLVKVAGLPQGVALACGCAAGATLAIVAPLGGWLCDRLGAPRRVLALSALLVGVAVVPGFQLLSARPSPGLAALVVAALVGVTALGMPACLLLVLEGYPARIRASGFSLVYSLGVAVFGGLAQPLVTVLMKAFSSPLAPACYVVACCLATLAGLSRLSGPEED